MPNNDDLTAQEQDYLPLIQHLHQLYDTRMQDEQDLHAIGTQLAQSRLTPLQEQGAIKQTAKDTVLPGSEYEDYDRIPPPFRSPSLRQRRTFQTLNILAAMLIVSLLTGSLVITLLLAQSHHAAPAARLQPFPACSTGSDMVTAAFSSIQMMSQTTGWGVVMGLGKEHQVVIDVGNETRLVHTTDGGCHWKIVKTLSSGSSITPFFLTETMAWVAIGNHLLHTSDAGKTWQMETFALAAGESIEIRDLTFLNNNTGWLIMEIQSSSAPPKTGSAAALFRTDDGGHHWKQLLRTQPGATSPLSAASHITFLTATTGWMTEGASLFMTHDGGESWQPQPLPLPDAIASLTAPLLAPPLFFSARDGLLPAAINGKPGGASNGFLSYVTHDGGQTWQWQSFVAVDYNELAREKARGGAVPDIYRPTPAPHFADMQFGWEGIPSLKMFTTSDGGKHWQPLDLHALPAGARQLQFANKSIGWALVTSSDGSASQIYRTTDGGKTWTPLALHIS